ncbi:MAG: Hpt domain-containing protein [Chromatiales bacterium]|nr:Hpt domain-containing protein [Chromatiales bacterium]
MSTLSKVDPSTLGWVKTEIDETLKQARLALEAYAENTADDSRLRFCATYLHQVLGTLQMVELDGAAMLARETEALANAILNGQVAPGPAAIDTLIRGILTLPDYLARLQVGQPDSPLRIFSLLNEVRTARGEAALNEPRPVPARSRRAPAAPRGRGPAKRCPVRGRRQDAAPGVPGHVAQLAARQRQQSAPERSGHHARAAAR